MDGPVLVTGATGNIGRAVVAALTARGIPVRAAGRDPADVRAVHGDAVEAVRLDFADPATFAPAASGAAGLFLVRPPAISRVGPTLNALIDVARRAGVGHVVFSSVAGADTNRVVPHHRVEAHLHDVGVGHTILRPGFFAQNLGDAYRADIRDDDRLYLPAGDARVAWIDVRDIGDVAAAVFAEPGPHRSRGYHLTGAQSVSLHQVAAVLSRALDRPIRYEPASIAGYARHLRDRGLPAPQILVQTALHAGLRRGDAAEVDPTLGDLLGRPPRTIADYVDDHAQLWQRDAAAAASVTIEPVTPPPGVRHVMNPVVRTLLGSRAGERIGDALGVLTFVGRRTGRRYAVPVGVHDVDDDTLVVTRAGWKANFRDGHRAQLRRAGRWHDVDGLLVEDVDAVADTYYAIHQRAGSAGGARRLGLRVEGGAPTRDDFADAARAHGLAVVRLGRPAED